MQLFFTYNPYTLQMFRLYFKYFIYHPLICVPCILEAEGYDVVLVVCLFGHKDHFTSVWFVGIKLQLECGSMKDIILYPVKLQTKLSMVGEWQKSLGNALFKLVQLTHILHFPEDFLTSTTLDNHSMYLSSEIKLDSNNPQNIFTVASSFSGDFIYCRITLARISTYIKLQEILSSTIILEIE